ncbi:MAG: hypothetical protein HY783_02685 [Chloroflexi bacterium]|nr:hypothetical protein [Chloroflexota bacterium]
MRYQLGCGLAWALGLLSLCALEWVALDLIVKYAPQGWHPILVALAAFVAVAGGWVALFLQMRRRKAGPYYSERER